MKRTIYTGWVFGLCRRFYSIDRAHTWVARLARQLGAGSECAFVSREGYRVDARGEWI